MSLTAAATEAKKRGPRVPGSVVPKLGTTEKDHYRGARLRFLRGVCFSRLDGLGFLMRRSRQTRSPLRFLRSGCFSHFVGLY